MNNKISDKDKKDWEDFLSKNDQLPNKDPEEKEKKNKFKVTYDLHGYSLDEANKKVKELIFDAYDKEISKLVIVTGKGLHSQNEKDPYVSNELGILKNSVPEYIKNDSELMSMIRDFQDANLEDGGSGTFYINLKKKFTK